MKYKYIPNSYNENLKAEKFKTEDEFLHCQIIYRTGLERHLKNIIDFKKINEILSIGDEKIPVVDDTSYNFYHQFSTFGNSYLFLRNNIHVENLTQNEIEELTTEDRLNAEFYNQTLSRVIFEGGNEMFLGVPIDKNLVLSKSLTFEFAYDQKKCQSLEQLNYIENTAKKVFSYIEECAKGKLNLPINFVMYDAIVDYYQPEDLDLKSELVENDFIKM